MKNFIFGCLAFLSIEIVNAQQVIKCFTDEIREAMLKENPEYLTQEEMANTAARLQAPLFKNTAVRYIPVVFHIIHKHGFENISQTQINDALRVLNEDFRKRSGTNGGVSTDPLAVDMLYEFRLAQLDPNGSPTSGVNRIFSTQTDNATDAVKALSYWDKNRYFNIWVVNNINNNGQQGTILGYAQFPFMGSANTDGVVIRADQMGAIETAQLSQVGRTLTHEAGHWVGLYHTFQGGCANTNCNSQGDQVCDTPPVASSTFGCPNSRNSCNTDNPDLNDLVRNYMDYADGTCMNMFTAGQKARVDAIMSQFRAYIYSLANINGAGINADGSYRALQASARKAPYSYGFDNNNPAADGWRFENYTCPGDSGWHINNTVKFSGNGSMAALNFKTSRLNVRNAFTSPVIDITTLNNPSIRFKLAYARRSTVSNDRLRVFISNSFGREEILVRTFTAAEMETAEIQNTSYMPNNSQWKDFSIDLTPYKNYTNLSVRIELQNLRGNNIFIDEFSIGEFTNIGEALKTQMQFNVFPNPVAKEGTVSFFLNQSQNVTMELIDLNGKTVKEIANNNFTAGENQVNFSIENLNKGLYLIKTQMPNGQFMHKILVD
jgi:hypothetical protein